VNRRGILERKCKQERQCQPNTNSRPRIGSSSAGPIFRPMQQNVQQMPQPSRQGFATPQHQIISCPNDYQTPNTRNQNVQRTTTNQSVIQTPSDKKCYNSRQKGHFAITCPNPRSCPPLILAPNSALPPNRNGHSSLLPAR
jgi:hypothetical protein